MSGSGRWVHAMYVSAGLCPNGCGETLIAHLMPDREGEPFVKVTMCEECEWLGPSRNRAAEILGNKRQYKVWKEDKCFA